jgi:nucleoside-diphosphate-sugar epimerase
MEAPKEAIKVRSSYNLAGMSFTPAQLAGAIQQHIPEFTINYEPDFRQPIADSWPSSIDDSSAREDWNWKPAYDTNGLVKLMLDNLRELVV